MILSVYQTPQYINIQGGLDDDQVEQYGYPCFLSGTVKDRKGESNPGNVRGERRGTCENIQCSHGRRAGFQLCCQTGG